MKYEDVGHQLDTTGRRVLGNCVLSTLQRLLASAVGDTVFSVRGSPGGGLESVAWAHSISSLL